MPQDSSDEPTHRGLYGGRILGDPGGDHAMTTIDIETITQAVRNALSHRDSRRDVLAQRIRDLAEQAMDAARVRSIDLPDPDGDRPDPDGDRARETGRIEYRTPVGDCSQWTTRMDQWTTRMDHPGHRGEPCLMLHLTGESGWRSLGPAPDVGFHDGANMQYQQGEARERETDLRIRPATVAQLRAVVRVLPSVLYGLLAETADCAQREAAEADVTLDEL